MKKICLLLTVISLIMISCTKDFREVKDIKEKENTVSAVVLPCTGNNWELDAKFHGDSRWDPVNNVYVPFIFTTLVYDDKLYVFDYTEQEVRFYNGTSWDSIPSPIPLAATSIPPTPSIMPYSRNFGFSIGNKGYIGKHGSGCGSFWEYSFTSNTWTQKACFPGLGGGGPFDSNASTFSIGSKGYVVAGQWDSFSYGNETWEYNRIFDTWTQKANLPQIGRGYATGFCIGSKGYIINGKTRVGNSEIYLRDLLEYDPVANAWTNKGLFPGTGRVYTSVFVIDEKAYIGGGGYTDFYKYDPINSWSQVADAPVANTGQGFSLNSKGYVISGMRKYNPLKCYSF